MHTYLRHLASRVAWLAAAVAPGGDLAAQGQPFGGRIEVDSEPGRGSTTDSASISPPCARMIFSEMARPRPVPSDFVVKNGMKSRCPAGSSSLP